jgi:3-phenylpropionate/trans-cinnamate dioxygenase ferredoxin reductase subunit
LTGEARRVEHWVEAERQGRHAALGLAGIEEAYREIPFFWTNQHDVSIKYAGYAGSFDRVVLRGDLEAQRWRDITATGRCGHREPGPDQSS